MQTNEHTSFFRSFEEKRLGLRKSHRQFVNARVCWKQRPHAATHCHMHMHTQKCCMLNATIHMSHITCCHCHCCHCSFVTHTWKCHMLNTTISMCCHCHSHSVGETWTCVHASEHCRTAAWWHVRTRAHAQSRPDPNHSRQLSSFSLFTSAKTGEKHSASTLHVKK